MLEIVLVEDHSLVTEGIKAILAGEKEMKCTGNFTNGKDVLEKLKSYRPDVIVMDINLPDCNGIELCKEVKQKYPVINVVALSINNQPAIIRKMMENGASGYVLKDAAQHEIVAAIQTVAKGKQYFSYSASISMRKPDTGELPPLTRREREILEKIADGLTNQEIANELFVDISTVSSHRKNMLAKYGVQNTAALVKLAIINKLI